MYSQKFTDRGQLFERLAFQVGDKQLAKEILKKRGHLEEDGKTYTATGMQRNMMTAEERAKDRYLKKTGKPLENLAYDEETNTVRDEGRLLY